MNEEEFENKYRTARYVTKPETWYLEGTEAILICLILAPETAEDAASGRWDGLFCGWKVDNKVFYGPGDVRLHTGWDEEGCVATEFEIHFDDCPHDWSLEEGDNAPKCLKCGHVLDNKDQHPGMRCLK